MSTFVDSLARLGDALGDVVGPMLGERALATSADDEVVAALVQGARILRWAEAILVESAAQLAERSAAAPHADRPETRRGCASVAELVQRATRVSRRSAGDILAAARAVREDVAPSSGERLPAELPHMRAALAAGHVGVDGLVAVAHVLRGCPAGRAGILAADEELAACARGEGADGAPPANADDLRTMALVWEMHLDQDGAEPRETRALRKRGLTLGMRRDGLVPIRGNLLPEVAEQLQRGFDALLNPKVDGVPVTGPRFVDSGDDAEAGADELDAASEAAADIRTRPQKQHDALAAILMRVAGSGMLPTLGGAAPTLIVSVREADLVRGRGGATLGGSSEPVSLAVARHIACTGAVERVVTADNGRIVAIEIQDRVFNHHQRRAIGLRDGGCLIPGCHVPFEWCELHHVEEHSRGGPTHTDNGVALCWGHHRTLDTSGWEIRVRDGVPEVRGPHWWDATGRWRPTTKSPSRLRDALQRRAAGE
ncbi:HNH endonuclease signature motif containing protein [Microbacterium sp. SLBN-146]|uniref:HNH endonuclease signature motif containing protein n=1 Tax=Microbacterium sp. SLBN-146 TaxID=2768457 RepID=UPI00114FB7C1|nr:HNH endonuclease signature motif containing protein [Microbacterium sp. SLBN-146]